MQSNAIHSVGGVHAACFGRSMGQHDYAGRIERDPFVQFELC